MRYNAQWIARQHAQAEADRVGHSDIARSHIVSESLGYHYPEMKDKDGKLIGPLPGKEAQRHKVLFTLTSGEIVESADYCTRLRNF